nr:MAG TPA: hypothetical protein [Inoviridae sp.]
MIKALKWILNSYTDEELEDMELWVDSYVNVTNILINNGNIDLITASAEIKVNDLITKERYE